MFVNFEKAFNKPEAQLIIPSVLVEYMNQSLPQGTQYQVQEDGTCVLVGTQSPITFSGFSLDLSEEQKKALGESFTNEDLQQYLYNSQTKVHLKLNEDGMLEVNGKKIPVSKVILRPMDPIKIEFKDLYIVPPKLPTSYTLPVGCVSCTRNILFKRIPNNSVNVEVTEVADDFPLKMRLFINNKEQSLKMNFSLHLEIAKTIQDIVDAIQIFNAFIEGTGTLLDQPLKTQKSISQAKKYDEKSLKLWKKILDLEKSLNVKFKPPQEAISYETAYLIEQLYQTLVKKVPVRDKEIIKSLNGEWTDIDTKAKIVDKIDKPIYLETHETKQFQLFNVKLELPLLRGIFNAVISNKMQTKGKTITQILLENEAPNKIMYSSIMYFQSEEKFTKFLSRDYNKRIEWLRAAKTPEEYL